MSSDNMVIVYLILTCVTCFVCGAISGIMLYRIIT